MSSWSPLRPARSPGRLTVVVAVVGVLLALAGCASGRGSGAGPLAKGPSASRPGVEEGSAVVSVVGSRAPAARERAPVRALRILRGWDRKRAAAYASADPRRLRGLYSPGSRAGAEDVRMLAEYTARGLVVDDLAMQVLEVRLLLASQDLVRLRVVERFAGGLVRPTSSGRGRLLPTGRVTPRVVTMVRGSPGWLVRAVRRG